MKEPRLLCLVIVGLIIVLRHAQADYTVTVKTEAYNNPNGHCYGCVPPGYIQPGCCDDFIYTSCSGYLRCDTYFNYCLLPSGRTPNPDTRTTSSGCTGGLTSQTNEDDANINYLSPTVLGLPNPFNLTGTTEQWMGVQLFIEAWDEDDYGNPHDLIDQFVIELDDTGIIPRETYNGIRGISRIDLTIEISCDSGFVGANCDMPASSIDCGQNGQLAMDATCMCDQGYTGSMCETNVDDCLLANMPCNNNGTCIDGINMYTCNCSMESGYTGQLCDENIDDCIGVDCNNGTCVDGLNTFTCNCDLGYTGQSCDTNIDDCIGVDCNNGTCVDGLNTFTCNCDLGYTGPDCAYLITESDDCIGVDCNNGTCVDNIDSFTCNCSLGYTGQFCDTNIDDCIGVDCNNGTCVDNVSLFICNCSQGYTGQFCEINTESDNCLGVNCNNGTCVDGINSFTCNCSLGYEGQFCESRSMGSCVGVTCSGNGQCLVKRDSSTCDCDPGYSGMQCETNINECAGVECSGNGQCIDGVNSYTCECNQGFTGQLCETVNNTFAEQGDLATIADRLYAFLPVILGSVLGGLIVILAAVSLLIILVAMCRFKKTKTSRKIKRQKVDKIITNNLAISHELNLGRENFTLEEEPIYESIPESRYLNGVNLGPNLLVHDSAPCRVSRISDDYEDVVIDSDDTDYEDYNHNTDSCIYDDIL